MRIAQVAPLYLPVPPPGRGGIELMVSYLTEELVKRGNDVTLFASGDSQTSAKLVNGAKKAFTFEKDFENWQKGKSSALTTQHIEKVFEQADQFEIIHGHFNQIFPTVAGRSKTPSVMTYHLPIKPEAHDKYLKTSNCHFVSLTKSQQAGLPNFIGTAPNGIPIDKIPFNAKKKNELIFVGRMATKKGPHYAIEAAEKTGLPLFMLGKSYPNIAEYWQYYQEKVKPRIDGKKIKHIEEVSNVEALKYMSQARALLMPIEWEEPFGLVMIEAMATGTPVIAFRHGSVPEVIVDGKTGFIVDTIEEMIEAIGKLDQINPADCRKHVEQNFTVEKMADAYENIYEKILKQGSHKK
ncbi:glycosyltransferase family 4 protein [Patescibacteria group bacterium]